MFPAFDPGVVQLLPSLFVYAPAEISFKPRITKLKNNVFKHRAR